MSAKEALLELAQRDGFITAQTVLDEARAESSPLHEHFEWDDSEAAEQYRLVQARGLIRRYKITIETAPEKVVQVRMLSNVPTSEGMGYALTSEAMKDDVQRDFIFQQAIREAAAFRRKYENLVDVEAVWRESSAKPRRRKAS